MTIHRIQFSIHLRFIMSWETTLNPVMAESSCGAFESVKVTRNA
ncbi:Uncharacterised protein [Mycobacteroides abscessus subsp. abscessus]|nr:Uncharacterised protein [Mycobacteroides abscessus subsp. abscessus]